MSLQQQQTFYTQLVLLMRQMYQECHLVHADLSEYNILVHEVHPLLCPLLCNMLTPAPQRLCCV